MRSSVKDREKDAKPEGLAVKDLVYQRVKELITNRHSVILRWVPGHSRVGGDERADSAAKDAPYRGGKETDFWSPLTHVKAELKRTRLAELSSWQNIKMQ